MNSKGFTLVEVMVAMIIVAVLATLSTGIYTKYVKTARLATVESNLDDVYRLSQICFSDGAEEITWQELEEHGFALYYGVILDIEDGTPGTFSVLGWHMDYPEDILQIDSSGNITRGKL